MSKIVKATISNVSRIMLVLGIVFCLISITGFVYSKVSFRDQVADETSDKMVKELLSEDSEDISFGSSGEIATTTNSNFSRLDSLNLTGNLRLGEATNFAEGLRTWAVVKDFTDATITPVAFQNTYGEDVAIRDLWLTNSGKATTTIRLCVTTSTASFLAGDNVSYLNADAGSCTLMRTFGNAWGADTGAVPTSTDFWLTNYAGTNTFVANAKLPVILKPDQYILVFATSSASDFSGNYGIVGSGNTFDGELGVILQATH